jgi:hypothetical protein
VVGLADGKDGRTEGQGAVKGAPHSRTQTFNSYQFLETCFSEFLICEYVCLGVSVGGKKGGLRSRKRG